MTRHFPGTHAAAAAAGLAALLGAAGCGPTPVEEQIVSFKTAEKIGKPVTIEGIPEAASLRRDTGQPTEFTLREEASANQMQIVAPADVTVPANFTSASYVVVTGSYDPSTRRFTASRVETRVPPREKQPRG